MYVIYGSHAMYQHVKPLTDHQNLPELLYWSIEGTCVYFHRLRLFQVHLITIYFHLISAYMLILNIEYNKNIFRVGCNLVITRFDCIQIPLLTQVLESVYILPVSQ